MVFVSSDKSAEELMAYMKVEFMMIIQTVDIFVMWVCERCVSCTELDELSCVVCNTCFVNGKDGNGNLTTMCNLKISRGRSGRTCRMKCDIAHMYAFINTVETVTCKQLLMRTELLKGVEQECHGDWLAVQHGTVLSQDLQKKFEVKPFLTISW